jgi:hypothetical protein
MIITPSPSVDDPDKYDDPEFNALIANLSIDDARPSDTPPPRTPSPRPPPYSVTVRTAHTFPYIRPRTRTRTTAPTTPTTPVLYRFSSPMQQGYTSDWCPFCKSLKCILLTNCLGHWPVVLHRVYTVDMCAMLAVPERSRVQKKQHMSFSAVGARASIAFGESMSSLPSSLLTPTSQGRKLSPMFRALAAVSSAGTPQSRQPKLLLITLRHVHGHAFPIPPSSLPSQHSLGLSRRALATTLFITLKHSTTDGIMSTVALAPACTVHSESFIPFWY